MSYKILRHSSGQVLLVGSLVLLAIGLSIAVVDAQRPPPGGRRAPAALAGTGFTYQGQLKNNGALVNNTCDFQFGLWDASSLGTQVGTTQTVSSLPVTNGLFTTPPIDFGNNAFQGDARWMAIAVVCPSGGGSYTALSPRQALTPAPYALALPGLYTQQNATSPNIIGGFNGNTVDGGVWGATIGGGGQSGFINHISANYGTIGGGYLNTAGGVGATIGGGGNHTASGDYATIGGGGNNAASNQYAAIGGGGNNTASNFYATVGGGCCNSASGYAAIIGGGYSNTANGLYATIGGGRSNNASGIGAFVGGGGYDGTTFAGNNASGNASTIGGGISNTIPTTGTYATIGGGYINTANGLYATIGGGRSNKAISNTATIGGGSFNNASGSVATISGGFSNNASGNTATIGGGQSNNASGNSATIGGGLSNTASGDYATVPGGQGNTAQGFASFAAGTQAKALHNGAFVWGDNTFMDFNSTAVNQFVVRASGGITMYTNSLATIGATLPPGSGTWSSVSDRHLKDNFVVVNGRDVLVRLAAVPIQTWNYKTQDPSIRHIGPMAQDFYAAFEVGEDDKHISTVDADGVAFAAIQGLYGVVQEKDAEIEKLKAQSEKQQARIEALQQQNATLDARLAALEQVSTFASLGVNSANAQSPRSPLNKGGEGGFAAIALAIGAVGVIALERARKGGAG